MEAFTITIGLMTMRGFTIHGRTCEKPVDNKSTRKAHVATSIDAGLGFIGQNIEHPEKVAHEFIKKKSDFQKNIERFLEKYRNLECPKSGLIIVSAIGFIKHVSMKWPIIPPS